MVGSTELEYLGRYWDHYCSIIRNSHSSKCLNVSDTCYVVFDRECLYIYKHRRRQNKWYRRTFSGWSDWSFDQFLERYNKKEKWEEP